MVSAEVSEDSHINLATVHTVKCQPVRRGLDDRVPVARGDHAGQQLLHLGRLQRGHVGSVETGLASGLELHAAEIARRAARRLQHGSDEVDGGGLAVGAGDADDPQSTCGMPVEGGCRLGECRPRVRHSYKSGLTRRDAGLPTGATVLLQEQRSGAPFQRLRDEVVPVFLEAGNGHEEGARHDATAVVADGGDAHRLAADHPRLAKFLEPAMSPAGLTGGRS